MSTQQLEALLLADALDEVLGYRSINPDVSKAAAELIRLHSDNAELLEALELCKGNIESLLASAHPKVFGTWLYVVCKAIAKATGEKS
jgi:hypothetical protein